ncbi:LOW QUALITY PROTEIN: galectin-4-like [Liolophura sinensis]|uniref:LOW QUALITY PROTEIN: galectin-4-like n=1 Tax=Liolophura sinensis TaxID=3198878 RepID=UPI0031594763
MAYPSGVGIVMNPTVPVSLAIEGGTCAGKMIIVQGVINPRANMFTINLSSGMPHEGSPDIPLHFNVRFTENCVVRNSLIGGNWGPEERNGNMPFKRGQAFEVIILVEQGMYKIAVNGKHFTEYHHRLQKELAHVVTINGEARLNFIKFQGGQGGGIPGAVPGCFPHGAPTLPGFKFQPPAGAAYPSPFPVTRLLLLYNPPVPFISQIPGGIRPGKMIYISGVPFSTASRFSINIQKGSFENNDVGLHFDVRLNFHDSHAVVVRNHRQKGCWGNEERHQSYFPFTPNSQFDIIILVEKQGFKIAVNNQHFTEFTHRILPLKALDTLEVSGDLRLTMVRFQ